jgi:hypothetical protein
MTEMTDICELSDTELDAVCGGSLVSISGPFVLINGSFNTQLQAATNIGVVAGNIGSEINFGQLAGNLGFQTIVPIV